MFEFLHSNHTTTLCISLRKCIFLLLNESLQVLVEFVLSYCVDVYLRQCWRLAGHAGRCQAVWGYEDGAQASAEVWPLACCADQLL